MQVLLSGIGDSSELSSLGIQTLMDSPDVGNNVQVGSFPSTATPLTMKLSAGPPVSGKRIHS